MADRASSPSGPLTAAGRSFHDRFVAAIDDDLDMPVALALLREILRSPLSEDERRWLILDADVVLGLDLDRVWIPADNAVPIEVTALLDARDEARRSREWARADALRDEIGALGWTVADGSEGSTVRRTS